MTKKLNIIATLGPSSEKKEDIKKIISGVSVLRLNASHLTPNSLKENLENLKKIFLEINYTIPVIIDLKGAKIRISDYPTTKTIPENIKIINSDFSDDISLIPLKNRLFFDTIKKGMKIYLNDTKVILNVEDIKDDQIECSVIKNGPLSSNKGINIKNHPIPYNKITDFDFKMINVGNLFDFTEFAFSFVHTGDEVKILKEVTSKRLTAKVERAESLDYLKNIDNNFDDIWLCRGDLGAQVGLENLGKIQYEFIKKIPKLKSNIYLAGEVLHHMTSFDTPTRTEIAQLYMLKEKGFKGFVLSDETAVGNNPVKVIEFLKNLL